MIGAMVCPLDPYCDSAIANGSAETELQSVLLQREEMGWENAGLCQVGIKTICLWVGASYIARCGKQSLYCRYLSAYDG